MNRAKKCPSCGFSAYKDVCPQCGHIIDSRLIDSVDITVTKNVTYNIFLMFLYALGIILFAAASVKPIIYLFDGRKEVATAMPTIAAVILTAGPLVLFSYLLTRILVKKTLVNKYGTAVKGIVYGYEDDTYEHEKGTRTEVCYIQYEQNSIPQMIKLTFNLNHHKDLTLEDRPYTIGAVLNIKIYRDMFFIK